MPWNADWPVNTISVKANQVKGDQNTKYIQATMGTSVVGTNTTSTRDHFWNVGANEDGRHRFMQSPAFTVATVPADPVIGTGMDAVEYVKVTSGRAERFHRNTQGIYQHVPSFLSGTIVVPSEYTTIVALPINVYGEIFMFTNASGHKSTQSGFFRTTATICDGTAYAQSSNTGDTNKPDPRFNLIFATGANATDLNLKVKTSESSNGLTWNYRITYRTI